MFFSVGDSLQVETLGSYTSATFEEVYNIDESLNSGAFGEVYKAHLVSNPSENYAVKVIDRSNCGNDDESVLFESKLLHDLSAVPNVVRIVDFFVTDDKMYMVQLLAEGGDVFDRIIEKESYIENDARSLAKILLTTVKALHELQVVHRDIKPENLLLKTRKDDTNILLCDFGEAKYLPKEQDQGLTTFCGSPAFVAPEIVEGIQYREEVDMWSVGSLLFMLLGGHPPFEGHNDFETYERISVADYTFDGKIWDQISNDAKHLISKLLTLDRKHRWSAMQALESDWFSSPTVVDNIPSSSAPAAASTTVNTTGNTLEEKQESECQQTPPVVETNNHSRTVEKSQLGIANNVARRKLKAAIHVIQLACAAQNAERTTGDIEEAPAVASATLTTTVKSLEEKQESQCQQTPQVVETNIHSTNVEKSQVGIANNVARRKLKAAIYVIQLACAAQDAERTTGNMEDFIDDNCIHLNKDNISFKEMTMRKIVEELLPDCEETEGTEDGSFLEDDFFNEGICGGQLSYWKTIVAQIRIRYGL